MASRSPSTFNYLTKSAMSPRKRIRTTEPSSVTDDQQFALDVSSLLLPDCFHPIAVTGDTSWHTLRYYYIDGRNLCGTAATETSQFAVFAWCDTAVNFSVGVYQSGAWVEHQVTSLQTLKHWRGWVPAVGTFTLNTDGTENVIQLGAKLTGWTASEILYVAGIGIFSG